MKDSHNILFISFGSQTKPAAWIFPHTLHSLLQQENCDTSSSFLLVDSHAGSPERMTSSGINEYIWQRNAASCRIGEKDIFHFRRFLTETKPVIIHFHQSSEMLWELVEVAKRELPAASIYITLHDLSFTCPAGRFMPPNERGDCFMRPSMCEKCASGKTKEMIWINRRRLLHYIGLADKIFAATGYILNAAMKWGINPEKMRIVSDCFPEQAPAHVSESARRPGRYAFVGEISPDSGILKILNACLLLPEEAKKVITLDVCGYGFHEQSEEFRSEITKLVSKLAAAEVIRWNECENLDDMLRCVAENDWILIPADQSSGASLALYAARSCGKPVVCAPAGALEERIKKNVTGMIVSDRGVRGWANTLLWLSSQTDIWNSMIRATGTLPAITRRALNEHLSHMELSDDAWAW